MEIHPLRHHQILENDLPLPKRSACHAVQEQQKRQPTSVPQKSKRCHTTTTPCSSRESSVTENYETHETSDTGNARRSTTPADKDVLSPLSVSAAEQYFTDYNIHELPSCDDSETSVKTESAVYVKARAEYLETQQK